MPAEHPTTETTIATGPLATAPTGSERPRILPVIKQLIVWQLLLGSVCAIAIAAHALYLAPKNQQQQFENQALALQKAVSTLSWAQLFGATTNTTPNTADNTSSAPVRALLQAALVGEPALLEVSLQAGAYRWHAVAAELAGRSVADNTHPSRSALRIEHQFILQRSPNNEPVRATLAILAMPDAGLHSGLLATGFALALAVSIIGLLGLNQQLQTESAALLRRLPGRIGTATQPSTTPDSIDLEPAENLLLRPLSDAVERAVATMRALEDKPDARSPSDAVSQRELELAQQSALRASRIKSNIIAKTSHELLTPLNSIAGFSAILARETPAGTQNQEFAQLIHDNAQQLNTLVNDLIVFSDRETNAIKLHYQPTDLYALLASIANSFAPAIAAQGLALRTDFDAVKTFNLATDPVRVRQIISNLLSNALRNTESGQIGIAAHFESTPDKSQWVKISVSDTGCGIEVAKQKSIFSEFVSGTSRKKQSVSHQPNTGQISRAADTTDEGLAATTTNPRARDAGLGFGLGLAIVDDLCQRMGASIALESAIDQGTTFTISLPARNIVKVSVNAASQSPLAYTPADQATASDNQLNVHINQRAGHTTGLPTLVVDDNPGNLMLLRHLLNTGGCDCDTASSSQQALAMLQQRTYAWLFIDIRMQPIDGLELRKKIRKLPTYKHTPIIACTAHTSDEEYRHLIDCGFDAVLPKPVDEHRLAALFEQFEGAIAEFSLADTPSPAPTKATDRKKMAASRAAQSISVSTAEPVFQVQAAIEHSGGDPEVAKSICLWMIEELASALKLQRRGFSCHRDRLEHFHRLNGSASMGGTPELKRLLHVLESRLKTCPDLADSLLAQQQRAVEEHQAALLQWLQQQDIESLFAAVKGC